MSAPRTQVAVAPSPTHSPVALPTVSVVGALPWLLLATLLAVVTLYFVSTEQGATSLLAGTAVHEWLHDGRHLLGFPCH